MDDKQILDSITAHYFYADRLTHTQLQEHRLLGSCPACRRDLAAAMSTANCEVRP